MSDDSERLAGIKDAKKEGFTHTNKAKVNGKEFDPEGSGYDYKTAKELGYTKDKKGHLPSRDYKSGMLLKGKEHPTFEKGVEADKKLGYRLEKKGNRYYTIKD